MTDELPGRLKDVHVSNFSAQLRKDRWPDPQRMYRHSTAADVVRFAEVLGFSEHATAETFTGPPFIATWRMNLVALSQKHNLYFVASRHNIHCYRPRNLKQILPSRPDIIVELPISRDAERVGGYINPVYSHSVNHLKVGNLGNLEILLMACDDGDILAFYTHQFQNEVTKVDVLERTRVIIPFFHCNVRKTAWGLAIHEQSRLIAVSSNRKEVTIFAPAISSGDEDEGCGIADGLSFPRIGQKGICPTSFKDRKVDFRIVLSLGEDSNNIPAIDFTSDENGEAEFVIACDINGLAWKLDPWAKMKQCLSGTKCENTVNTHISGNERSWGVLCLSAGHFKNVKSLQEAWGVEDLAKASILEWRSLRTGAADHFINVTLNETESVVDLAKSTKTDSWALLHDEGVLQEDTAECASEESLPEDDFSDVSGDDFSEAGSHTSLLRSVNATEVSSTLMESSDPSKATDEPVLELTIQDWERRHRPKLGDDSIRRFYASQHDTGVSFGPQQHEPLGPRALHREKRRQEGQALRLEAARAEHDAEINLLQILIHLPPELRTSIRNWDDLQILSRVYNRLDSKGIIPLIPSNMPHTSTDRPLILLRTYSHNIELVELSLHTSLPTRIIRRIQIEDEHGMDRLNILHPIPELNLVLIASQAGLVVVLTLTKVSDPKRKLKPFLTYRMERLLPLQEHRQEYQPSCPLLGMAVSPLQGSREGGMGSRMRRRWRVMLHYYDHTVLSYEVYRGEKGLLCFEGGAGVRVGG